MRQIGSIVLLTLFAIATTGAQGPAGAPSAPHPKKSATEAEKTRLGDLVDQLMRSHAGNNEDVLKQLDSQCAEAMVQGNIDALAAIEADGFTFTGPDGSISTKQQDLETIRSGALVYDAIALSDVAVRVFEGAGVITGRADVKGRYGN